MNFGKPTNSDAALTEVFGEGTVQRETESVRICVSTRCVADDNDSARLGARKTMDKLYEEIRKLQKSVDLPDEGLQSNFSISPFYRHKDDMRIHVGYCAEFSLVLESPDTEKATQIFEALARVKSCTVDSPTFHIGDKAMQVMHNDAFKHAVTAAKARFVFQCGVIGFDPTDFEIAHWRYDRLGHNSVSGKRLSISPNKVSLKGDSAEIKGKVYLTYSRREN